MPKGTGQKEKLLRLLEILQKKTDENHPMTREQLIAELERFDISAERKSIYSDIQTLTDMGYDIVATKGKTAGYFCASREFELPELKLLVDAVQSSRFIPQEKSEKLIKKLEALTSEHNARKLHRQVRLLNRAKTMNNSVLYNIDALNEAILNNKKITFKYFDWEVDFSGKEKIKRVYRRDNKQYEVSPWYLVWENENYYLIAYDDEAGIPKHYRVDKMERIALMEEARQGSKEMANLDVATFANKTFSMFAGKEESVLLRLPKRLLGVVVDRFGKDLMLMPDQNDAEHFLVRVTVSVSPQFYAWLFSFEGEVQVMGPAEVADDY